MRKRKFQSLLLALALLLGLLFAAPDRAEAQTEEQLVQNQYGWFPYPNNKWHSFKVVESNASHRSALNSYLGRALSNYTRDTPYTMYIDQNDRRPDVYVWATDESNFRLRGTIAQVSCRENKLSGVCNSFNIRFNEDIFFSMSYAAREHIMCHEIMHTLGFIDYQQANPPTSGCLPRSSQGGTSWTLSKAEKAVIKRMYERDVA